MCSQHLVNLQHAVCWSTEQNKYFRVCILPAHAWADECIWGGAKHHPTMRACIVSQGSQYLIDVQRQQELLQQAHKIAKIDTIMAGMHLLCPTR